MAQAVAQPSDSSGNSDVDILNYALTLEYLESEFYKQGLDAGVLSGREQELIAAVGDHESAHVTAVSDTVTQLGGKPVEKPNIKFPEGTFGSKAKFLETASTFEELGVKAYHGQVTKISSGEVLAAAAAIAGVESRHAAVIAQLQGGEPFPRPIEQPKPMSFVLSKAKPFLP